MIILILGCGGEHLSNGGSSKSSCQSRVGFHYFAKVLITRILMMVVMMMMMMLANTILTMTRYLTALEKIMSENGSTGFYVGNKMTIADLAMWRMWGWIVSYMMMLVMMIMMTIIACFNDYDINDQNTLIIKTKVKINQNKCFRPAELLMAFLHPCWTPILRFRKFRSQWFQNSFIYQIEKSF